jgi:hypothetical protein
MVDRFRNDREAASVSSRPRVSPDGECQPRGVKEPETAKVEDEKLGLLGLYAL